MNDLLDIAFARLGSARSVVSAAIVVIPIGITRVLGIVVVVAVVRRAITGVVRLIVVAIVGVSAISIWALAADMEELETVDVANEFLLKLARRPIRASTGAEDFLACAGSTVTIGVDDDVTCAWFRI